MRKLWKGLLLGSMAGGLAFWALRRRAGGRQAAGLAGTRPVAKTVHGLGRQWRDVQGAWRVGRRMMRRRRMLSGVARFARRLLR